MRLQASVEARCHICELNPATIREPKGNGTGGYQSVCLDCLYTNEDYDVLEELLAMLDSVD